ncbi:carbohydrate ABC transporter permease [Arcanobacterium hippocoleae]|uniref:N-acetylglucosamine transport system permease protein n=1 Tax=Arcanobacterium hippocoleae TaxID=149017 RepID=A0ABU1SZS7_9ACTO|nr:sugar ABC transporter permease [Arcanobacterium hippocoleae]MDR6938590.1 N-acetylglucosamine transport system permease protein [Arcanobacterium hippocoleae]
MEGMMPGSKELHETEKVHATQKKYARPKKSGNASQKTRHTRRFAFLCSLPAAILMFIFIVIPTVQVFQMSVFKWGGYSPEKTFVGLNNFVILFSDMKFLEAFQNTVLLLVVVTSITLPAAVIFGAILVQLKIYGTGFIRFILYLPSILSMVIIAAIFAAIYAQNDGLLNSVLSAIGLEQYAQAWLGDQSIVIYSIGFAMLWQSCGYYMVMYMSAMAGIDASIYEAARIDGASKVRQLFTITIPLIWNNIRTTLTFFIISSINLSFVIVRAMTGGGPDGSSEVLLGYLYNQAYDNSQFGYGMAIGVVTFTFSFALSLIVSRVTKRDVIQYG